MSLGEELKSAMPSFMQFCSRVDQSAVQEDWWTAGSDAGKWPKVRRYLGARWGGNGDAVGVWKGGKRKFVTDFRPFRPRTRHYNA